MRFLAAFLMALALATPLSYAQTAPAQSEQPGFPIGVADYNRIVATSSAGRSMQQQLQQIRTQMLQAIQSEEQAIQAEAQRLSQAASGQTREQLLSNTTLTGQITANDRRAAALRQRAETDSRDYAFTEQSALQEFNRQLSPVLNEVMQQRGVVLVLDTNAIVQAAQQLDLTQDILTRLDQRVPAISVTRQTAPAAQAPAQPSR